MGELGDAIDLLETVKKKEAELAEINTKLSKKELAEQAGTLQGLIIKYQRGAIEALLRVQDQRDEISKRWIDLVDALAVSKDALKEAESAIRSVAGRRTADLESQLDTSMKVNKELRNEIDMLKVRIKTLLGG